MGMFVSSENISHLFLVGKEGEGRARLVGFGIFHMSPQICFLPNQEENWCGRNFPPNWGPYRHIYFYFLTVFTFTHFYFSHPLLLLPPKQSLVNKLNYWLPVLSLTPPYFKANKCWLVGDSLLVHLPCDFSKSLKSISQFNA